LTVNVLARDLICDVNLLSVGGRARAAICVKYVNRCHCQRFVGHQFASNSNPKQCFRWKFV